MKNRHKQKLAVLSIALFVMFNAPVLLLFNYVGKLFGLPVIYMYIFIIWLASSVFSFLIFKRFNE